jgi:uncharacterized protein (TIGR02001 family)
MSLHPYALRFLALALLLLLGAPVWAEDDDGSNPDWFPGEFTGNVSFTTDYPFRGISQTNEHGAIQGGIDYGLSFTDAFGVYAGGWASNVNFGDGDNAQVEMDIYGGVSGAVGAFSYDVIAIYYEYPGANQSLNYDYWEFGPTLGFDFGVASISAGYLWSPEFFGHSGDGHWFHGGVEVPVPESALPSWLGIAASANIGHQAIDEDSVFGVPDYLTWDAGVSVSAFGLDVDVRYFDTDISRDRCFGGGADAGDLCAERIVGTVSKSF